MRVICFTALLYILTRALNRQRLSILSVAEGDKEAGGDVGNALLWVGTVRPCSSQIVVFRIQMSEDGGVILNVVDAVRVAEDEIEVPCDMVGSRILNLVRSDNRRKILVVADTAGLQFYLNRSPVCFPDVIKDVETAQTIKGRVEMPVESCRKVLFAICSEGEVGRL